MGAGADSATFAVQCSVPASSQHRTEPSTSMAVGQAMVEAVRNETVGAAVPLVGCGCERQREGGEDEDMPHASFSLGGAASQAVRASMRITRIVLSWLMDARRMRCQRSRGTFLTWTVVVLMLARLPRQHAGCQTLRTSTGIGNAPAASPKRHTSIDPSKALDPVARSHTRSPAGMR